MNTHGDLASMILILLSAAFVGFVHSLNPGHWLPVVLMAKSRKWPLRTSVFGALSLAAGHIFVSSLFGLLAMWVGLHLIAQNEGRIERWAGAVLAIFGLVYALVSYLRHSDCHSHHSLPKKQGARKTPFLFLFSLGFSPCVAVLPVFGAAAVEGPWVLILSLICFSIGVLGALLGATVLVSLGLMKLDHPVFEHYGDVITGLGIAIMGSILFLVS